MFLLTLANGQAQYWFCVSQGYVSEERSPLTISPDEKISLFSNNPFQMTSRGIRLLVPQKTIEKYLNGGEFLPASKELWDRIWTTQITLPRYIQEKYPDLFSGPWLVDPYLYNLNCRGVFLTTKNRLVFWVVVNNEHLYITDGQASALVKSKSPVMFEKTPFPEPSPVRWKTTNPPRKVSYIAQEPLWLSGNAEDSWDVVRMERDMETVRKILTDGRFMPVMPFRLNTDKEGSIERIEVPISESGTINDETKKWVRDVSQYEPPVGVAVVNDKHIVYWYAPKDRPVVLVWNFDGQNGIVGDLQSVRKKKAAEGKEKGGQVDNAR